MDAVQATRATLEPSLVPEQKAAQSILAPAAGTEHLQPVLGLPPATKPATPLLVNVEFEDGAIRPLGEAHRPTIDSQRDEQAHVDAHRSDLML